MISRRMHYTPEKTNASPSQSSCLDAYKQDKPQSSPCTAATTFQSCPAEISLEKSPLNHEMSQP
jgi:hypothetical protein